MGESTNACATLRFDRRVRLEFRGATITSDAGLLACRELDDALGLTETADECLQESRAGHNVRHRLVGLLTQSVFSRLAGYEDINDAVWRADDPTIYLSVVQRVGSSTVVRGSVGSYWPVIAGAKLREGTTTILPRGRALQGVGLSSMRFHPTGRGPKTTKMDKKHGSRQESHPLSDRPEIDWPCRTRISCHHLVWTAH